ncbi:MAG: IS3 family transposase, partial [bacterium]
SFNKNIKNNLLTKYKFESIINLNSKLLEFVDDYNQNKRLRSFSV